MKDINRISIIGGPGTGKSTFNWEKTNKKYIYEILEKYKNKRVIIFKNRRKLNKWYEEKFGEKIINRLKSSKFTIYVNKT